MYYAIYKNLRDGAWRCLLNHNITSLPVDVLKIAKAASVKVVKNSFVNVLYENEKAKTYYDGQQWLIIYDETAPTAEARFAIAHELGHIFLGHITTHTKYSRVSEFSKKPRSEMQADMFALRLLCPVCVLVKMNCISTDDIAKLCNVPRDWALARHKRIIELNKKNKYFTSELEQRLYENFKSFIFQNSTPKEIKKD